MEELPRPLRASGEAVNGKPQARPYEYRGGRPGSMRISELCEWGWERRAKHARCPGCWCFCHDKGER